MLDQLRPILDQFVGQAKEWQPLLAALLVLVGAIIVAVAMVRAAKIRAATMTERREAATTHDMRIAETLTAPAVPEAVRSVVGDLEILRSLLRSALASLSSVDTNHEAARVLCTRIAALQDQYVPPVGANTRVRDTYAGLARQFELLRTLLDNQWSPSEASAILIQLNASARSLSVVLDQGAPHKFG